MTEEISLIVQINSLPVWGRALLWLGLMIILIRVFIYLFQRFAYLPFQLFRGGIVCIYIVLSWVIITPLHKKFKGIFRKINNGITELFGLIDEGINKFLFLIKNHKIKIFGILVVLYGLTIVFIGLPEWLTMNESAGIRIVQKIYLKFESSLFGNYSDIG